MPTAPTAKPNYPCTRFDGNGYLTRATSASLQTLGAAGTILMRFKTSGLGAEQALFRSAGQCYVRISDTTYIVVTVAGLSNKSPVVTLSANVWYDLMISWAYPGNMVIKVCPTGGSDTTSAEYATASGGSWTGINYIGSYAGASLWLNGSMRDVMLLSRVITAGEWTAYKAGTKPTGSVVADWPLYPDWNDDSGNANHLSSGGIAPTFNPIANWPCTRFGGNGYLTTADFAAARLTTTGCITAWIRRDGVPVPYATVIGRTGLGPGAASNTAYYLGYYSGTFSGKICDGTTSIAVTNALATDSWWHFVRFWWDGSKLYMRVDEKGTADEAAQTLNAQTGSSLSVSVGSKHLTSYATNAWCGSLRDVRLFTTTPSDADALRVMAGEVLGTEVERWPLYPSWAGASGHTLTAGGVSPTFNPKAAPTPKAVPA